jgi:hypothetical protein
MQVIEFHAGLSIYSHRERGIIRPSTAKEAPMTDEQQNHLTNARTILSAAMALLTREQTGNPHALPDQVAALLDKAAQDLAEVAEAA